VKRGYFNCQNGGDVYEAHREMPSRKTTFGSPKKSILKKSTAATDAGDNDLTASDAAVTGWSQRTVTTPRAESSSRGGGRKGGLRKQSAVVPESADPTPRAVLHQAADHATLESMEHTPSKYQHHFPACIDVHSSTVINIHYIPRGFWESVLHRISKS